MERNDKMWKLCVEHGRCYKCKGLADTTRKLRGLDKTFPFCVRCVPDQVAYYEDLDRKKAERKAKNQALAEANVGSYI